MICPFCKKQVNDGAKFCKYCGKKLEDSALALPAEQEKEAVEKVQEISESEKKFNEEKAEFEQAAKNEERGNLENNDKKEITAGSEKMEIVIFIIILTLVVGFTLSLIGFQF